MEETDGKGGLAGKAHVLMGKLIFQKKIMEKQNKSIKFGTNRVHMARHGLILSQNGAIPSRIIFVRVLDPKTPIKK